MASLDHSGGGGGGVGSNRCKIIFYRQKFFCYINIFCYKFNSTDEFPESWGGVHPHTPARYAPE